MEFKFSIGQTVKHIATATWETEKQDVSIKWVLPSNIEQRWFILERHSQECPGGVQLHYTCRGVVRGGGITKECFRFNEVELMPLE